MSDVNPSWLDGLQEYCYRPPIPLCNPLSKLELHDIVLGRHAAGCRLSSFLLASRFSYRVCRMMFLPSQAASRRSLLAHMIVSLFFAATAYAAISLDIHPHPSYLAERKNGLLRRENSVSDKLNPGSHSHFYFANVSIGTPPQPVSLKVSISVSDTWVWAQNATVCNSSSTACSGDSSYAPNSSSTYAYLNSGFSVAYTSGLRASGDWATETMLIGGSQFSVQQFGVAYNGTPGAQFDKDSSDATLGLGFEAQESQFTAGGAQYPNIPQALSNAGLINSNAYSLWLNSLEDSTGSLLFGAVDEEKYEGNLMTLPIVATTEAASGMVLKLTDLRFGQSQPLKGGDIPVTLTLGSSLFKFPSNITNGLYTAVGAKYDNASNTAGIDCGQASNSVTLDFTFGWAPISIPMSELVLQNGTDGDKCIFAVQVDEETATLGLGFLRSTYVVCDLSNQEISIAPTKFNVEKSNVVDIQNGINGVPGAVRTLTATAASQTASTSPTGSGAPASSSQAPPSSKGLSSGASAGIGVGVALGVLALCAGAYILWRRRRKQRLAATKHEDYHYDAIKAELPADSTGRHEMADPSKVSEVVPSNEPVEVAGSEPQRHELG